MEHCKKLVLVPHETVARLHEKPISRTPAVTMGELDSEMHKILERKAEDSVKWKMYEQALQRYLHFANEQKKPLELILPSSDDRPENTHNTTIREQITSIIPRKYRNAAISLFDFVASPRAHSHISWDHTGLVHFDGKVHPQTSIIDLISDASRTRKSVQAKGWKAFAEALGRLNVPLDFVGNTNYKSYIRQQTGSGFDAKIKVKTPYKRPIVTHGHARLPKTKWTRWT